jgi:hypothetical protein
MGTPTQSINIMPCKGNEGIGSGGTTESSALVSEIKTENSVKSSEHRSASR